MIKRAKRWGRKLLRRSIMSMAELTASTIERYVPGNDAYEIFERHGFHLLRKHYYLPIPDRDDLNEKFWQTSSKLVGMEMNETSALDLLENIFAPYAEEVRQQFPLHKESASP